MWARVLLVLRRVMKPDDDLDDHGLPPDPDEDEKVTNVLLSEYQTITRQIIHWDTFFWAKSRFFLAAEGVAFLATSDRIVKALGGCTTLSLGVFWVLLGMVMLNWYLCYVWFLTNRRNREFLAFRFERGYAIEGHQALQTRDQDGQPAPILRLYHHQDERLKDAAIRNKFSHYWEISIPVVFGLAWAGLLVAGIYLLGPKWGQGLIGSVLAIVIGFVVMCIYNGWQRRNLPAEVGTVRAT